MDVGSVKWSENVRMFIHETRDVVDFIMNDDVKILIMRYALNNHSPPLSLPRPSLKKKEEEEEEEREKRWPKGAKEPSAKKPLLPNKFDKS